MSEKWDRRTLLRRCASVGVLSFCAGSFAHLLTADETRATISDEMAFPGALNASELDLRLAAALSSDGQTDCVPPQSVTAFPETFVRERVLHLPFEGMEAGQSGRAVVAYQVCDAPADVTLEGQTEGDAELAEALEVGLWRERQPDAVSVSGSSTLYHGSLSPLFEDRKLFRVADCVGCRPRGIGLEWTLPETIDRALSNASLQLALEFTAEQCTEGRRTNDE